MAVGSLSYCEHSGDKSREHITKNTYWDRLRYKLILQCLDVSINQISFCYAYTDTDNASTSEIGKILEYLLVGVSKRDMAEEMNVLLLIRSL